MENKLLILCCLLIGICFSCKHIQEQKQEREPITVGVQIIGDEVVHLPNNYVGMVEENSSVSLSFSAGGTVEQVLVKEGDFVRKGQKLVVVNRELAQNACNTAKATYEQAQDAYRRLKQVYDQGSVAEVKWVEMQTNLEKAKSMYEIAKKNLQDCDLYAPQNGYIGTINAQVGSNIAPMQPAIVILDISKVNVNFTVPEKEISSIKIGQTATVSITALDGKTFTGKVFDKGISANIVSHSYDVKIAINNADKALLPGMIGKVNLSDSSIVSECVVPASVVLLNNDNSKFVWIDSLGEARKRNISIGGYSGNGVLVSEGLSAGDKVIVKGYQKISTGMKIKSQIVENK